MKVFKLVSRSVMIYAMQGDDYVRLDDNRGSGYVYKNGEFQLERYTRDIHYGYINYQKELLEYKKKRDKLIDVLSLKRIKQGNFRLLRKNGEAFKLKPLEAYALMYDRQEMLGSDKKIVAKIDHYPKRGENSVILLDVDSRQYEWAECYEFMFFYVIDNECYGRRFDTKEIVKFDSELNRVWTYKYDGKKPNTPNMRRCVDFKQSVIFNISAKPISRPNGVALDGEICSLAKSDGSVNWHRKFPIQVDDCQRLTENTIVLFSGNELFVLDGDKGETISAISTGLNMQTRSAFLTVMSPYVYLFSRDDNVLHIYDIETLECLRKIEGAECGGNFYHMPKVVDGKLFVPLVDSHYCSPLLIVDGENIQSPVELEQEPKFTISTPDENNPAIIMEVNHPDLGDVLRFAEIHALTHAEEQGNEGRGLGNNPHFDGRVILKYSGCTADRNEALEKFDTLKERFDFYAQDSVYQCRSGDGSRYATLAYELL